jgi:hypothetical protein
MKWQCNSCIDSGAPCEIGRMLLRSSKEKCPNYRQKEETRK